VSAAAHIPAPAKRVYEIIADYHNGHPHILPKPQFEEMIVEEGGAGAGTVIFLKMRLMGSVRTLHALVSEPEPGRVLVETDTATGDETTFTVEPRADGREAYVTITTRFNTRNGIRGRLEGWLARRLLRPVYVEELEQLAAFAARGSA
jgi:hypothetical protein